VGVKFATNLKRVKQATIEWAHAKRKHESQDLVDIEASI
jgi:hypothetical protein